MLHNTLVPCCNCNSSGVNLVETIQNRYYISTTKEVIAPPKFLDFVKWKMSSYASLTMILCSESSVPFHLRMTICHLKKKQFQKHSVCFIYIKEPILLANERNTHFRKWMMTSSKILDMMSIFACKSVHSCKPFPKQQKKKKNFSIFTIPMDSHFPDGFSGYKIVTKQFKDKI